MTDQQLAGTFSCCYCCTRNHRLYWKVHMLSKISLSFVWLKTCQAFPERDVVWMGMGCSKASLCCSAFPDVSAAHAKGTNATPSHHRCRLLICPLITSWMVPRLCGPQDSVHGFMRPKNILNELWPREDDAVSRSWYSFYVHLWVAWWTVFRELSVNTVHHTVWSTVWVDKILTSYKLYTRSKVKITLRP